MLNFQEFYNMWRLFFFSLTLTICYRCPQPSSSNAWRSTSSGGRPTWSGSPSPRQSRTLRWITDLALFRGLQAHFNGGNLHFDDYIAKMTAGSQGAIAAAVHRMPKKSSRAYEYGPEKSVPNRETRRVHFFQPPFLSTTMKHAALHHGSHAAGPPHRGVRQREGQPLQGEDVVLWPHLMVKGHLLVTLTKPTTNQTTCDL